MQVAPKRKTGTEVPVLSTEINNLRGENGNFSTRFSGAIQADRDGFSTLDLSLAGGSRKTALRGAPEWG
jgi:hypothetical protein